MLNLYDEVRGRKRYNKFTIGDLLFAEYTCPIKEESAGIWTHTDYLVHVVSGKKVWHTADGSWSAEAGQTLFFKKGGAVIEQFFDAEFCLLLFFIPDDFVREIVAEFPGGSFGVSPDSRWKTGTVRVHNDVGLSVFFQSMLAYFSGAEKPSESLLKVKLRELVVSILTGKDNPLLSSYFRTLANEDAPVIGEIMEANFRYNLSLEEFARMTHRSLSTFKRDFKRVYNDTPGKWLLNKRLEYAAVLLRSSKTNISQIVYECGFEDLSHFSRAFKNKFGLPPTEFRTPKREQA